MYIHVNFLHKNQVYIPMKLVYATMYVYIVELNYKVAVKLLLVLAVRSPMSLILS